MSNALELFLEAETASVAGNADRFGSRWRLTGAGLSDVWRYGDLDLPAVSGRLLLRGPNGTGKTTALESLWPFLLDLNGARLAAGKSRPTTLKLLMSEGAGSRRRRYGYVWLTLAPPAQLSSEPSTQVTFGVRLQYSAGGSPVLPVPFTFPGRPLHDVPLRTEHGAALELDQFTHLVDNAGGQVFASPEEYVDHLAARVWQTKADDLRQLASRLREVRNPTLLGEVSPEKAATALRASLPGVAEPVLQATADALAESEKTRQEFARDRNAAEVIKDFLRLWIGHVVEVTRAALERAEEAATDVGVRRTAIGRQRIAVTRAGDGLERATTELEGLEHRHEELVARIRAVELSPAYRAAGRTAELEQMALAQQQRAQAELAGLVAAAAEAGRGAARSRSDLDEIIVDLAQALADAAAAGAEPVTPASLLSWANRPRAVLRVDDTSIDPGSGIRVTSDPDALAALPVAWRARAETEEGTARKAQLAVKAHVEVERAFAAAEKAEATRTQAEAALQEQLQVSERAADAARQEARSLAKQVQSWADALSEAREKDHLQDPAPDAEVSDDDPPEEPWDVAVFNHASEVLPQLAGAEPAAVLQELDELARVVGRLSERAAARNEERARQLKQDARRQRTAAVDLQREASTLRGGRLLPLPRPPWAAGGDDARALAAALNWRADVPDADRVLIEAALAEAGVLGATLEAEGASTAAWRVDAAGETRADNLTAVLTVDTDHRLAAPARKILERVELLGSAQTADGAALCIGRDGTFRAGVLLGEPGPLLARTGKLKPATHVGAAGRRAAAVARAKQLEQEAHELDQQAAAADQQATMRSTAARTLRAQTATYPARTNLRNLESFRASAVRLSDERQQRANLAATQAEVARRAFTRENHEWRTRTADLGLPPDVAKLAALVQQSISAAKALRTSAAMMSSRLIPRIARAVTTVADEPALVAALIERAGTTKDAYRQAEQTQTLLKQLRQEVGDPAAELRLFEQLSENRRIIGARIEPAREAKATAATTLATSQDRLSAAEGELLRAEPRQLATQAHLAELLSQPAVAQALEMTSELPDGEDLLKYLSKHLSTRRTSSRRAVQDRYDTARAELAGTWNLARDDAGDSLPELDLYLFAHAELDYTPPSAAAQAEHLADSAARALAAAEESALTDFVVGRLPSAIGAAWQRMQDWKGEVNQKMRSAESSSGVGIQVQLKLTADLSPAARTVYELSCLLGDADRTEEQKAAVGAALQALLAAADGETMRDRLDAALDIRDWVEVHYLVSRPDGASGRKTSVWGARTGLSGGERRLVVLAPMLAAVAAAYDRFGQSGLRLVPLDEVPAEVDERGREGLARYIAELDLDVLCTSYLWDGAPGAWDGLDAHDLEAGSDGTVVAFPMLVRGLVPLPGDLEQSR